MHFCRQICVIEFFLEFLIRVFGLSFALLKVLLKNPWPELNKSLQSLIGWNSLPLFLYLIIKNTPAKVHRQKIHRYFGYTGKSVTMEGFPAAKLQRHFWFDGKWCNGKRYNGKRYNGKITAAFSTQSTRAKQWD